MVKERFPRDADSFEDVMHYYNNRQLQLGRFGVKFKSFRDIGYGVHVDIEYDNQEYVSVYLYERFRGKGLFKDYLKDSGKTVLTIGDCHLAEYLHRYNIPYRLAPDPTDNPSYKLISQLYGDGAAKRSGVYFINHIDEGLYILDQINASQEAKDAYCLHPVLQMDADLSKAYTFDYLKEHNINNKVIILAMEYRWVANNYLSARDIKDISEINLSVLPEVNQMLIADKVQNRKDFELYHINTHERSKYLQPYFKNWLEKLNVSEEQYLKLKQDLLSFQLYDKRN